MLVGSPAYFVRGFGFARAQRLRGGEGAEAGSEITQRRLLPKIELIVH